MLPSEGHGQSRWSIFAPRLVTALCLFMIPGCLLVQPLDDAKDDAAAGEGGTGGAGGARGGTSSGGTGGKGGNSTGGVGGATGGAGGSTGGAGGSTGAAAGVGGSATGGSAGKGGAGGASGAAGSGNTGNVTLVYGPVWTFDESLEGWALGFAEPSALGLDASAIHSPADGEPDAGSVELTLPFHGPNQTVEVGVRLPRLIDFTGQTLAARVKLDSGFFGATEEPGGVKLFVKTGNAFDYADGVWSDLVPGEWVTVVFDLDAPDYDEGIDPTDVRELGVTFNSTTDADAGWTNATVFLDTVGWVGAERPPCILDPLLLDDMETPDGFGWPCQQDGRSGGWYVFDDATPEATRTPSGSASPFPLEELDVPRGRSTRAVHVSGNGFTDWGGGVGMSLVAGTPETVSDWDASGYAGISFWARGSGTMWAQLSLREARDANQDYPGTCEPVLGFNCNDSYVGSAVSLTDTWTEYVVPFATLNQEGWGHPAVWSYNLSAIEFRWGADEPFDFWIDDLRLLERECDDDATVQCTAGGERCRRGTLVPTACDTECSQRGYAGSTCTPDGCECSAPLNPATEVALDALCECGAPSLDCSPEGRALLEARTAVMSDLSSQILCYEDYYSATPPSDCAGALSDCWN